MSEYTLATTLLFKDLPADKLALLEQECIWRTYGANETIIKFGDEYTDVFVIFDGETHVLNYSENGKAIDYATLKTGDLFGEMAAIDCLPRSAWVTTKSPATIAVLSGELFISTITEHPQSALNLLRRLSSIVRQGNEQISNVRLLSAEQRIGLELLRLTGSEVLGGKSSMIESLPNQTDIANVVGLTRETGARVMSKFSQEKIIERKGRTLEILDRRRLQELAIP